MGYPVMHWVRQAIPTCIAKKTLKKEATKAQISGQMETEIIAVKSQGQAELATLQEARQEAQGTTLSPQSQEPRHNKQGYKQYHYRGRSCAYP